MSLVPWAFRDPFFVEPYNRSSFWDRPSRIWDIDRFDPWDREFRELTRLPEYLRRNFDSLISDSDAKVAFDKDKFQVNVDVQQFAPHEITVRTTGDNTITVEGKHEERPDEHGFIQRQFVRRYVLPKGHDVNHVQSNLSSDGVLTITAPRTDQHQAIGYRTVPIQRTGAPSKAVQFKK